MTFRLSRRTSRAGGLRTCSAQRVRERVRLRARGPGGRTSWTMPVAVAQVDEDQPAVVAAAVDPAGDARRRDRRARPSALRPRRRGSRWRAASSCQRPPSQHQRDHGAAGRSRPARRTLHVLQRSRALLADDRDRARADPVGLLQLIPSSSGRPAPSAPIGPARRASVAGLEAGRAAGGRRSRRRTGRTAAAGAGLLTGRQQRSARCPAPQPTPGVGGPPSCSIEAVVAAAAGDARLGAERVAGELEDGARVVVERRARASGRARTARSAPSSSSRTVGAGARRPRRSGGRAAAARRPSPRACRGGRRRRRAAD